MQKFKLVRFIHYSLHAAFVPTGGEDLRSYSRLDEVFPPGGLVYYKKTLQDIHKNAKQY